jgi:predicted MFS family arabinose efflux permease
MRVEWGALVPEQERTAAYSLVYLTQVLSILTGPRVLSAFIALANPSVAVVCVAGLAGIGTLAYAALLARRGATARGLGGTRARVLGSPGVRALVAVAAVTGGVAGSLDVGVPTLASAHHDPAASGLLMAAAAVGGIIGGVTYGSRRWSGDPLWRLLALQAVMTAAMALTLGLSGLVVVGAVLLVVGVALNPVLTTISVLVDRHVPTGGAAEAFGWLSLGISAGTGLSTAIAGAIAQHSNSHAAFAVGTAAGVVGLAVVAACSRRLRSPVAS